MEKATLVILAGGKSSRFGKDKSQMRIIGRPLIEHFSGSEVRVESSVPLPIERDGDTFDTLVTSYEASCLPASNLLVVDGHSPYYER